MDCSVYKVEFHLVGSSCFRWCCGSQRFFWISLKRLYARGECLKCPTILRYMTRASITARCVSTSSWIISWSVCAKQPKSVYAASLIALTMFEALSRRMRWICSFFYYPSCKHFFVFAANQIISPVCSSGKDCACKTADFLSKESVSQWAVRLNRVATDICAPDVCYEAKQLRVSNFRLQTGCYAFHDSRQNCLCHIFSTWEYLGSSVLKCLVKPSFSTIIEKGWVSIAIISLISLWTCWARGSLMSHAWTRSPLSKVLVV